MFKKWFKKEETKQLEIYAPLSGEVVPLEDVPDPVFGQKMMGEGVAILPEDGHVFSPVDGEIIQVIKSKHAIGMRAQDGTEILIHVGLETVELKGEGFNVHVENGDTVKTGDPIMTFDLEFIKQHAKDTITPIVITSSLNDTNKEYTITDAEEVKAPDSILLTVKQQ
ncbi:MAG TPA: PTS glucose transporter subunit IIA [Cerasibacillus sp.]|uniref:PTS sugar transporter subunit IIA n=1 Tax=Cerasibacillus sp. TaxID=2498711 RepID=UPI002F3FC215